MRTYIITKTKDSCRFSNRIGRIRMMSIYVLTKHLNHDVVAASGYVRQCRKDYGNKEWNANIFACSFIPGMDLTHTEIMHCNALMKRMANLRVGEYLEITLPNGLFRDEIRRYLAA